MKVLTCNACNKEWEDEAEQKLHYRSEWHRYNLKRKVAGVPGVTEALFQARQLSLAEEHNKMTATPSIYTCALCAKEYRNFKAHAQHLKSRMHIINASQELGLTSSITIIKPVADRMANRSTSFNKSVDFGDVDNGESGESESEWEEVDPNDDVEEANDSLTNLHVHEHTSSSAVKGENMDEDEELDVSSCFMCDQKHDDIESCILHMHKNHGFFIPDIEYLKNPAGLLTYVGLKVKRDFICLYCNELCHPFQSLEAVRKHMIAKGHCKLSFGDGGDDDGELEDFYDYSSSYMDKAGKQLVALDATTHNVELGTGGAELIITQNTDNGIVVRTIGPREFLRYYRQNPRPSRDKGLSRAILLSSRFRRMVLARVHSNGNILRTKVRRDRNHNGLEAQQLKIGMKNNIIRNLPKNVPY